MVAQDKELVLCGWVWGALCTKIQVEKEIENNLSILYKAGAYL